MEEQKKGKFIVFEGIDGCGKSTQAYLFVKYLFTKNKYTHVLLTREPYKSRKIRDILKKKHNAYEEAELLTKLFFQDRKKHVKEVILPALKKGIYVVSDRYKLSTIAYQSTQGMPLQKLINMHKNMPIPDITFIVDANARTAKERIEKEQKIIEQKFEKSIEFQELLRKVYLKLPKIINNERIFIINGEKTINEVAKEVQEIYEREIEN
ncbi:MAG: dTMP kinase [Candidatus Pacearchaeota archaeon]